MSVRVMSGLVGVSMWTSFVVGRMARRTFSGFGGVDEGELDAVADDDLVEEARGAAVDVVAADDVVAGVEHGDQRGDGGHAAGEDVAAGSAFERGEVGFERVAGGVGDAGVFPAAVFLDALELVGGGEIDGDVDGAGARVGFLSVVDGAGGEAVLGVSHVNSRVQGTGCRAKMKFPIYAHQAYTGRSR